MQYNFILLRTDKGRRYARKILNSVKWINEHKYPNDTFKTYDYTIDEFMAKSNQRFYDDFENGKTIIHARCANPRTQWTIKLRELETWGFHVVNSVDAIELTSDKLACSLKLQDKVAHPKSWEYSKSNRQDNYADFVELLDNIIEQSPTGFFIAKPITSLEQGANVKKINCELTYKEIEDLINQVPGRKVVLQEYIPYTALHRVIVIGGKALPYTFIDKPEWHPNDWKVSCCLNRTTMRLNENVHDNILRLAEVTQKEVGGVINFIDIFEFVDNNGFTCWTNAEINTACSLNIHENLAKQAGRPDWNIHYRIANQLVKELLGG